MKVTVQDLRFAYREIGASLRHDLEHRAYLSAGLDISLLVVGLPLVTLVALPGVAFDAATARVRRTAPAQDLANKPDGFIHIESQ